MTLGRIAGVYGIKGWVKVQSFTRPIENLLDYPDWFLSGRDGFESKLLEGRVHGGGIVARLADAGGVAIEDRDEAARLIGAEVQVARSALPVPEAGQWYWSDLVGLEVESTTGESLGRIAAMTDNGAQDVMVVDEAGVEGAGQRLIPFVIGPIVKSVEVEGGRIVVDWASDW